MSWRNIGHGLLDMGSELEGDTVMAEGYIFKN